jgi:hypothetical protein
MPEYDLTIRVHDEEKLAIIISALKGAGTLLTVAPVSEKATRTGAKRRNGGAQTTDVAMHMLRNAPIVEYEDMERAFEEAGFRASSVSPTMSTLVKAGKAQRMNSGQFALVKKP